jgi:hypothetical protein
MCVEWWVAPDRRRLLHESPMMAAEPSHLVRGRREEEQEERRWGRMRLPGSDLTEIESHGSPAGAVILKSVSGP